MQTNVQQAHIFCNPHCAGPTLFRGWDARDTLCMARHFLRAWRKHSKLTLEQVADHLGMSHSQLSRIETFKQPYNQELIEALAELYRCDVVDFFVRDPTQPETMWTVYRKAKPSDRRRIDAIAEALLREPPN